MNVSGNNGSTPRRSYTRKTVCRRCGLANKHVCIHVDIASDEATYEMPDSVRYAALEASWASEVEHEEWLREVGELADARSSKCGACEGVGTPFGYWHREGCDLDRSVSATARYLRKHPELARRSFRRLLIRIRWAAINRRCLRCLHEPAADGITSCRPCVSHG